MLALFATMVLSAEYSGGIDRDHRRFKVQERDLEQRERVRPRPAVLWGDTEAHGVGTASTRQQQVPTGKIERNKRL